MALQEFDRKPQEAHDSESEMSFLPRLRNVLENWDSLDPQAQKDAFKYYGYTALVATGMTAAAVAAFMARI
jgi:hypothetical protein